MELQCAEYVELGAVVSDETDPNPSLVISGVVNAQEPGEYVVIYTATDASGNSATATRTVRILPPVPVLNAISPEAAVANGPDLELQLTGSCFAPGAVVRWNGALYNTVQASGEEHQRFTAHRHDTGLRICDHS